MKRLNEKQRVLVAKTLAEGNSIRAAADLTGIARMTVERLLRDISEGCARYQGQNLRNLFCKRITCIETWSFASGPKRKDQRGNDVWTWVSIDSESKLAICWLVGDRSASAAFALIDDCTSRLSHRVRLGTDGHRARLSATTSALGNDVEYSTLVRLYGNGTDSEKCYSVAEDEEFQTEDTTQVTSRSVLAHYPGGTKFCSRKIDRHRQSVAFHFMHYNFSFVHQTTRVTPAMAAGITNRAWSIEDLVSLTQISGA